MEDFLKFFNEQISYGYYMHLEIGYNKIADYCIRVYRKGAGPKGEDVEMVWVQDSDIELAFAKAYVQLKEWMRNHRGDY